MFSFVAEWGCSLGGPTTVETADSSSWWQENYDDKKKEKLKFRDQNSRPQSVSSLTLLDAQTDVSFQTFVKNVRKKILIHGVLGQNGKNDRWVVETSMLRQLRRTDRLYWRSEVCRWMRMIFWLNCTWRNGLIEGVPDAVTYLISVRRNNNHELVTIQMISIL